MIIKSLVSVIVVNWNGQKWLKECLDSLKAQTYKNFEVIIADNNSTDRSVELVKKNYQQVKIIENKSNLGFAIANNEAAKKAKGKYLFFLNNDTKVDSCVLFELVKRMEENPNIGIGGCKMMSYDGRRLFHTGIGLDIFGYPIISEKTFYVEGSALMIKKKLFLKISGFDQKYFMFHEDIDLAWRVRLMGYKVVSFSSAVVYHVAGASAGGGEKSKGKYKSSYLRRYYSERNGIRTLLKNYSPLTLFAIAPIMVLISIAEVLFYLVVARDIKAVALYFKGYAWNLWNIGDTLKERIKVQRWRKVSDLKLIKDIYLGSGKLVALFKVGIPEFR